jgi:sugar transferase (PEP-CTERM/EpsH1 system associated)
LKVLFLTSRFPYPLEKGDKLRAYHQLMQLSQQADVVLCCVTDQKISQEDILHFEPKIKVYQLPLQKWKLPIRLLRAMFHGWPLQVGLFYEPKLRKHLEDINEKEKPDLIFCQLVRAAEYVRHFPEVKVLDYMDALSVNMRRRASQESLLLKPIFAREADLMAKYEKNVYPDFDKTYIISSQDKALMGFPDKDKIKVLPNGIDSTYFSPVATAETYDVCFVGNMGYYPNVIAASYLIEKIMPLVWEKRPNTTVLLAGARPSQNVRRLATDKVFVSGWIEDIRQAYSSSKVFCAPLFAGSGQQNKILEAMSMMKACITTALVNNAIEAIPGEMVSIAEDPKSFAVAILRLLDNPENALKMGQNARDFVESKYSWSNVLDILGSGR